MRLTREEYNELMNNYLTINYNAVWDGYQEMLKDTGRYVEIEGVSDGFDEYLFECMEEEYGKIIISDEPEKWNR